MNAPNPTCHRARCSNALHCALIIVALCATALYFYEQRRAAETAAEFKAAVRGSGAGQWYWDIDKNVLRWDDRMFDLFHASKDGWVSIRGAWEWHGSQADSPAGALTRLLLPADSPMVMSALNKAAMTQSSFQAVFRAVGDDGELSIIRAGGAVYGGGRYMTGLCLPFIEGSAPTTLNINSLLPKPSMLASEPAEKF